MIPNRRVQDPASGRIQALKEEAEVDEAPRRTLVAPLFGLRLRIDEENPPAPKKSE